MRFSRTFAPIALQALAVSAQYVPPNAQCTEYTVPVSVKTNIVAFNTTKWVDNFGLADFLFYAASRPDAGFPPPVTGPTNPFSGDFKISATFCTPKHHTDKAKTVMLASHGIGFNRGYWNSAYQPENYNYVQYMIEQGYSVFFYDRLGVGKSEPGKLSGYVNQARIQIEILSILASSIKQGHYTDSIGTPDKLILVGHSFGSFISNALLAQSPDAADGAILTGLAYSIDARSQIVAQAPRIAATLQSKWKGLDTGTLSQVDIYAVILNFFKAPYYTVDTAAYAFANGEPFAITEFLTLTNNNYNAPNFHGPVLVISGEYDFIVCGGYCPGVIEEPAKTYFSGAQPFKAYSQPGTGHGLNYAKNATGTYQVIADFLSASGL